MNAQKGQLPASTQTPKRLGHLASQVVRSTKTNLRSKSWVDSGVQVFAVPKSAVPRTITGRRFSGETVRQSIELAATTQLKKTGLHVVPAPEVSMLSPQQLVAQGHVAPELLDNLVNAHAVVALRYELSPALSTSTIERELAYAI